MVRRSIYPPAWAWYFVSFGFMCLLMGCGYSLAQSRNYQIELAEYRLAVGSSIFEVKKVSDTLEQVSNSSAIAPHDRQKIQKLTQQSNAVLDAVEQEIEQKTDQLLKVDKEE